MPTDRGLRIIAAHMLALKQSAPAYDQRPKSLAPPKLIRHSYCEYFSFERCQLRNRHIEGHMSLHVDYLISGAGAMGMAFADVILHESDKTIALWIMPLPWRSLE